MPVGGRLSGTLSDKEVEITDHTPPIDWDKVRIQAATAAMQGFLSNSSFYGDVTGAKDVADTSVRFADALIERLKKGGNNGNGKGRGGRTTPADEG